MKDRTVRVEVIDVNAASLRVDCDVLVAFSSPIPSPNLFNSLDKESIFSLVMNESYRKVRQGPRSRERIVPRAMPERCA